MTYCEIFTIGDADFLLKTVMQSKQQALWAYCPNIYTVISARLVLFGHDFSLNESSLSSAASVSPIPPLPTGLVIGRVPRGPRRPRPHSVAISASSSSSCGQLQHSPIRRKLQREKPREFFRVAAKIQQTKMLVKVWWFVFIWAGLAVFFSSDKI